MTCSVFTVWDPFQDMDMTCSVFTVWDPTLFTCKQCRIPDCKSAPPPLPTLRDHTHDSLS